MGSRSGQIISKIKLLPFAFVVRSTSSIFAQKVVRDNLSIADTLVNFTGKEKQALKIKYATDKPTDNVDETQDWQWVYMESIQEHQLLIE